MKPPRKEWQVWQKNGEMSKVWADDVKLTTTGDLVFYTLLEVPQVNEKGEQMYEPNICLSVPHDEWTKFEQLRYGQPLWTQSGKLEAAQAA